jgi:hypothetical protein
MIYARKILEERKALKKRKDFLKRESQRVIKIDGGSDLPDEELFLRWKMDGNSVFLKINQYAPGYFSEGEPDYEIPEDKLPSLQSALELKLSGKDFPSTGLEPYYSFFEGGINLDEYIRETDDSLLSEILKFLKKGARRALSPMRKEINFQVGSFSGGVIELKWKFNNGGEELSLHIATYFRGEPHGGTLEYEVPEENLPSFQKALESQLEGKEFPDLGIRESSGYYEEYLNDFVKSLEETTLREVLSYVKNR